MTIKHFNLYFENGFYVSIFGLLLVLLLLVVIPYIVSIYAKKKKDAEIKRELRMMIGVILFTLNECKVFPTTSNRDEVRIYVRRLIALGLANDQHLTDLERMLDQAPAQVKVDEPEPTSLSFVEAKDMIEQACSKMTETAKRNVIQQTLIIDTVFRVKETDERLLSDWLAGICP